MRQRIVRSRLIPISTHKHGLHTTHLRLTPRKVAVPKHLPRLPAPPRVANPHVPPRHARLLVRDEVRAHRGARPRGVRRHGQRVHRAGRQHRGEQQQVRVRQRGHDARGGVHREPRARARDDKGARRAARARVRRRGLHARPIPDLRVRVLSAQPESH